MEEGVFNQVTEFVQIFVIGPLHRAIVSGRNNRDHALRFGLFDHGIAVVAFIGDQIIGSQAFNQATSLRAIRSGTLRDNDSERQTMRIHGQVYFGVEPPLVRLMS